MALVVFDLNGTLLDPGPQGDAIQAAVRLAIVHSLTGEFRPLRELIEAVGGEVPDRMPPFPDVPPGLDRLAAAGHRLAVLTNSAGETGRRHVEGAGLLPRFAGVVGADEAGAYKPGRRAYDAALAAFRAGDEPCWMVAAHDWDIVGAHAAGLRTVYVDRGGPRPVSVTPDLLVGGVDEIDPAALG